MIVRAHDLKYNYPELTEHRGEFEWSLATIAAGYPQRIPNPDRELAQGDPLYTSFVDIFGDDVSGNQSKSWNKHWNIYMTHRNLPREQLQLQYNIHFLSTSQHASVVEQFQGIYGVLRCVVDVVFKE